MNRLKELRQEKGLTQQALADEMGVTKRTYIYWEKGDRQIKPEKAQQLADYFGVGVGYLLGYSEFRKLEESLLQKPFKNMGEMQDFSNEVLKNGISSFVGSDKADKVLDYINQQFLKENIISPVPAEIITGHRDSLLNALDFAPDTIQEIVYLWGVLSEDDRINVLNLIKSLANIKDTPDN